MSESKKKIFGPIEIFAFLATVALLAYIGLKSGGGSIVERTESVELIEDRSRIGGSQENRKYRQDNEESVETILRQIADQYSGKPVKKAKVQQQMKAAKMSEDELEYLEKVKQEKKKENTDQSIDWFAVLKTSHKTYKNVKSAFQKAGIDVETAEDNVTSKLVNEVAARSFYAQIEELFDIPEKETRAFAEKGEKAVSDWARFVEEKTE